ncbi:hypothetical protein ACU5DF_02025 [Aliivibrio wodanis]|uniref:hypothetical protein n=1 Tax=Aliivibrio TaxID=511678 RepID=UPI003D0A0368
MTLSNIVHFSSIVCVGIACTRLLWLKDFSLKAVPLDLLIIHAQSAAILPMIFILAVASIKPDITSKINGLNAHYLIAAISLAYVSIKSLTL